MTNKFETWLGNEADAIKTKLKPLEAKALTLLSASYHATLTALETYGPELLEKFGEDVLAIALPAFKAAFSSATGSLADKTKTAASAAGNASKDAIKSGAITVGVTLADDVVEAVITDAVTKAKAAAQTEVAPADDLLATSTVPAAGTDSSPAKS